MAILLAAGPDFVRAEPVWVADEYLLDRWTTADGLPVNGTNAVHIGKSGYLWLATFDGLARFDGHRFVVFNASRNPGLPGNRLIELTPTPDGQLWVRTARKHLARFDGHRFQTFGRDRGLPDSQVLFTQVDDVGTLWAATSHGLARLEGGRFHPWATEVIDGEVRAIVSQGDGQIWVGTAKGGLLALDGETLQRRYTREDGLVHNRVQALAFDADNALWIGGGRGLARLIDESVEPIPGFADKEILSLQPTPDGAMLVQATVGIYRWHDGRWQTLDHNPIIARTELAEVAPNGAIWSIRQHVLTHNGAKVAESLCPINGLDIDATGAVWLATACDGLWRIRRRKVLAVGEEQGLPPGPVYGLDQAPDGTLWAASAGGTLSAIRNGRVIGVHQIGVPGHHQGTVLAESDGRVWASQYGLCEWVNGACRTLAGLPVPLRSRFVRALFRDIGGDLWVGSMMGLWRHHDGTWQRMDTRLALTPRARVRAIFQAHSGNMWFATLADGLRRRTPAGDVSRYGTGEGLSSAAIRDIHEDPGGYLWVATEDRGLCRSRAPEQAPDVLFDCIGTGQGLHSNSLHRILADDSGRLWFNSNTGVFWIGRQALEDVFAGRADRVYPRVYTERDGLPDREGNGGVQNAGVRLADDRLAFPGQGGIAIFDPRDAGTGPSPPPRVVVEELLLPGGRAMPARSMIELPRGERVFSVRFTGLTTGLTDPLYFRYRLGGRSEDWTEIGNDRTLSFERLPPGDYELQLAAIDAASGITGPATRMQLRLPAYFYETTAFRVGLAACLLAAVLIAFLRHQRAAANRQRVLEIEVERHTAEAEKRAAEARSQQQVAENALATVDRQRGEIQKLAEARTRFFANVSHELRTPLTLLVGPLQDQADGAPPPPELARVMLRNARRLERLVEQLLDLERIDAQRFPLRPADLNLASLARDSAMAFEVLAGREHIELETRLDADPVPVRADPDQLARVLGNLLSNALKFTPAGGRVCLALRTRTVDEASGDDSIREAELSVADTGPGVPAEWRERIFDRFSQMGRLATHAREGAGLGLALCSEVVELHHGRLYVEAASGGGSRFVLCLPLAESSRLSTEAVSTHLAAAEARTSEALHEPAPAVSPSPGTTATASRERYRLLIAEDHDDMRGYLETVLVGDYDVHAVADGAAALAAARREPPDVIVSDIVMPRRDGYGLARALRADPELAGIPLIFLTARASDTDEIEGLALGADQYLRKPFQSDVLRAHIAAALSTCQRLRDEFVRRPPEPDQQSVTDLPGRIRVWVESNAHHGSLSVTDLAAAMNMSRATLHRKLVAETGQGPRAFIRSVRLARARRLLKEAAGNVSEVAYAVGFASLSGFSRAYRDFYGEPPSSGVR